MIAKIKIKKVIPNVTIRWIDNENVIATSKYSIYFGSIKKNDIILKKLVDLNVNAIPNILANSKIVARALRLGIRSIIKLSNGIILAVANKKVFRIENNKINIVYRFNRGLGPLRDGICEDENNNIYMGEYFLNNSRKSSVKLLKSEDNGKSWISIYEFTGIRHIHCVLYDPFEKKIWIGTGDRDKESSILFSEDGGESWKSIGSGKQMFRTMTLLFTEEYVYWGTDTPSRQSYIYRYHRRDGKIERLTPVDGPVYYSILLENGWMFFSTGVEGKSERKCGAWDNKAHIWASLNGKKWYDIFSLEKDRWPYIFGFGQIYFPRGKSKNLLVFTTLNLNRFNNTTFICEIISK